MPKANEDLQHEQDEDLDDQEELESGAEDDGSDVDSRVKNEDEDQHENHPEEGDDESEEERERIRERRREERQRKKQIQREREESLRRQVEAERHRVNELTERLAIIERRSTGSEMAQLDDSIKKAAEASEWFKGQIAEAASQGNHLGVAEATEKMIAAREEAQRLARIKDAHSQRQQQAPALDPRVHQHLVRFQEKHKWFDGANEDSRVARAIENSLAGEGWDVRLPQYWEELDFRLKKYLPHRFNSASVPSEKQRESRRNVITGSGRESSSGASKGEYNLSPERVQALKDAGAWENPEKRAKMIKAYREYDKSNRN